MSDKVFLLPISSGMLITEDLQDGSSIGTLIITDPFAKP
jgi:predicted nucleic acid-binding protein